VILYMLWTLCIQKEQQAESDYRFMSMSLGGDCEDVDCSTDSLVKAVETLYGVGILSSVASGNSGCNVSHYD